MYIYSETKRGVESECKKPFRGGIVMKAVCFVEKIGYRLGKKQIRKKTKLAR